MTSVGDKLAKRPWRIRCTTVKRSQKTAWPKSGEKTSLPTKADVPKTPILKPSSSAISP